MRRFLVWCAVAVAAVALLGGVADPVRALVYDKSFYDSVAWTWQYRTGATPVYNCLAFAMGYTDRCIWPWGASNPTVSQVTSYLDAHGRHPTSDVNKTIMIAYGKNGTVRHFSKTVTESPRVCDAKWGQLERFRHYAWDPYRDSGAYGSPMQKYKWDHE